MSTSRNSKRQRNEPVSQRWPADEVVRWPVDRLIDYARNARVHSAAQIAQIVASITEWGFTMPVLIDPEGGLIAGHARAAAARTLGLTEVPAMVAEGWSARQIKAYRLADNRLAECSTWSDELLKLELGDLNLDGFDLGLLGWGKTDLDKLLSPGTTGLTDPDALPEALPRRVNRGEAWTLGEHVLICGDCLDVLPDLHRVDAIVTDPPYGIGFGYDQHDDNDYGPEGYGAWIWRIVERAEALLPPGGPVFVWQSPKNVRDFANWFPRDWRLFIGARNFTQMVKGAVMQSAYDAVLCWWTPGADPWTAGDSNRDWHLADTASQVSKPDNIQARHPCPRPTAQVVCVVEQWVKPGGTVLEPFAGSGTTVIACEMMGRRCVAIEKSPAYCDIIVARWEQFTGKEATRVE